MSICGSFLISAEVRKNTAQGARTNQGNGHRWVSAQKDHELFATLASVVGKNKRNLAIRIITRVTCRILPATAAHRYHLWAPAASYIIVQRVCGFG